jgi:hypothetical protein
VDERTVARIERNNQTFRDANERIHDAAQEHNHDMERIPFLCECPVEDCVQILRLTDEQYSAVRADPNHYVTAPGHEAIETLVGDVVSRNDGYVVVRK